MAIRFDKGDSVKYTGPSNLYPMDSVLAEWYLDRDAVYLVERVVASLPPHVELRLAGIMMPLVSVLFKKL